MLAGRYTWVRGIGAVSVLLGCGASLVTACGGRTSALDPDIYWTNGGGGSSAILPQAGRSGSGGQPGIAGSVASGGVSSKPGKPNAGNVDPSLAIVPCQNYCPGFGTQCAQLVMGPDCLSACNGETNGFGARCQALAIQSLNCLAPFFTPGGNPNACTAAVQRALTKCGKAVDAFEKCKAEVSGEPMIGAPIPTPTPMPMPTPAGFDLAQCAPGSPLTQDSACKQDWSCPDGEYITFCSPGQNNLSDCGCYKANGEMISGQQPTQNGACVVATELCSLPARH
jgi:hypothetical protein